MPVGIHTDTAMWGALIVESIAVMPPSMSPTWAIIVEMSKPTGCTYEGFSVLGQAGVGARRRLAPCTEQHRGHRARQKLSLVISAQSLFLPRQGQEFRALRLPRSQVCRTTPFCTSFFATT